MIMEDRGFISKIEALIDRKRGAAGAVDEVIGSYVEAFLRMDDPYLRERSADMEDIGRRIIDCLHGKSKSGARLGGKRILVADGMLPSDLALLDPEKLLGIVTLNGDTNSHAAIMARSLGIPAVLLKEEEIAGILPNGSLIIDGNAGCVYIDPDDQIRSEYDRLQRDYQLKRRELDELRDVPAVTPDGERVFLRANIGLVSDIRIALANGAEGVGLYRTEFPYMARNSFPSRKEQHRLYRNILEGFAPMPVTVRTLDIGGDKGLPYFAHPKEENPFMGLRSIRLSLEREDVFRDQLAAILSASPFGKAKIMFPMVSSVDEVRTVKRIVEEVRREVEIRGAAVSPEIPLGIMIEIPAAVQTAHILVKEVDFFSIGTNDLIQYTLAADRNNPKVRKYYDPYHPAVLQSIRKVSDAARSAGKTVSVCGEMASDPLNAVLLLGIGITELSISAPYIPVVKQAILKTTRSKAAKIAETVLAMDSALEIRAYLDTEAKELGLR
jgi:phosphotransferase system enzyme I (PtsP)